MEDLHMMVPGHSRTILNFHQFTDSLPAMATFDAFRTNITSLDMLTEDTLQKIWSIDKESILLPNVNVRVPYP